MKKQNTSHYAEIALRAAGQIFLFDTNQLELEQGMSVVCETEHGQTIGNVVKLCDPSTQPPNNFRPLKIIRIANEKDHYRAKLNSQKAKEAHQYCQSLVKQHKIAMKLVDTEYALNTNRLLFYFSAEGRVDFRQLVKDLARYFQIRIEMRQIGVRDVAKLVGGYGVCGQELCCSRFLRTFSTVSVRMAKDQNLSLNSQKITGVCGRLMCCLSYEQGFYQAAKKVMPSIGQTIQTPKGSGLIRFVHPVSQKVWVVFEEQNKSFEEVFALEEIQEFAQLNEKLQELEIQEWKSLKAEHKKKGKDAVEPFMEARRAVSKTRLEQEALDADEDEMRTLALLEQEELGKAKQTEKSWQQRKRTEKKQGTKPSSPPRPRVPSQNASQNKPESGRKPEGQEAPQENNTKKASFAKQENKTEEKMGNNASFQKRKWNKKKKDKPSDSSPSEKKTP